MRYWRFAALAVCTSCISYSQLTYPRVETLAGGFTGDGGPGRLAALNGVGDIAIDANQNVYIADYNNHRIRRITPAGVITTVAGSGESGYSGDAGPATSAKLNFPRGIAIDRNLNIYIADTGNNRIRRVDRFSGNISTVLGTGESSSLGDDGVATAATTSSPTHLTIDFSGNIYFVETALHRVRRIDSTTGAVRRYAGSGLGNNGDGGPAKNANFNTPESITADSAGNIYVADRKNNSIRVIDRNFETIKTVSAGIALNEPIGLALDATGGTIYVADASSRVVRLAGGTVAGVNGRSGFTGDGGPANVAQLNSPSSLAWRTGQLYISDSGNLRVRNVDLTSGVITTVAGSVDPGPSVKRLTNPGALALDANGIAYVVEPLNHRILQVDKSGNMTVFAGTGTAGFSGDGGPAKQAQLNSPAAVAIDSKGRVCVADRANNRIRCIDQAQNITTFAGTGEVGSAGDGQPATKGQLNAPRAIAFAKNGTLYIGDTGNHSLRTVDSQGNIRTTAFLTGDFDSIALDGPQNLILAESSTGLIRRISASTGETQTLLQGTFGAIPAGLAGDAVGSLYFTDIRSHVIRKRDDNGTNSIVTGTLSAGYGGDNGLPTQASWNTPTGIAFDAKGNIVLVDSLNQRLRRIVYGPDVAPPPTGTIALTLASSPSGQALVVDGTVMTTPVTLNWYPNSEHIVNAPNPTAGTSTRYFYDRWSDGLGQSHTIITPLGNATITALFRTQHLLTLVGSEGGQIVANPPASDGFYNLGTLVQLTAQAQSGYAFRNFNGDLSGSTNPQSVTISAPTKVGALFLPTAAPVLTPDSPNIAFQFQSGATPTVVTRSINLTTSVPVSFTADANAPWIRVPGSGTTPSAVTVTFDLTGFAPGQYNGSVFFRSAAVLNDLEVPVTVTVLPKPVLTVTVSGQAPPDLIDLTVDQNSQTTLPMVVTSSQPAVVSVSPSAAWLRISPLSSIAPLSAVVTATAAALATGTYNANLTITAPFATPIVIPVRLTVQIPPVKPRLITDASATGLQFQMVQGGVAPAAQVLNITSSTTPLTFTVDTSVTSDRNWIQVDRRTGQTPSQIQVNILPTVITQPGTYIGQLTLTAQDNLIQIPIVLSLQKAQPPSLLVDTSVLRFSGSNNSDVQRTSMMIQNPSQNVLSFSVSGSTVSGDGWLTYSPSDGGTFADRPALVEVAVDPHNLAVGSYMGQLEIAPAPNSGLKSQFIPVVFAVSGTGRKLIAADSSLFVRAIRGQPVLPTVPIDMVVAGTVNWTATANQSWVKLSFNGGSAATSIQGTFQPGSAQLNMDVDLAGLNPGENYAQIVVDSNSDGGRITIPVTVQILPSGSSYVRVLPAGMAFVTQGTSTRSAVFVASKAGSVIANPNVPWMSVSVSTSSVLSTLQITARAAGIPPGQEQRGTITIQDSAGLSATLSVLLYVPVLGNSSGSQASGNCSPTRFIPLFSSLQGTFDQPGGAGTNTEVVIIDDCGNPVESGLTGGSLSNRDPQLNLLSLGGGRWKTTWTPRSQGSGFVAMNVVSGNPRQGIEASKPTNVFASVTTPLGVPVLAVDPIQTTDGMTAPFLIPGGQFVIKGSGFVATGETVSVALGSGIATVVRVQPDSILIQVPDDAPVNTQLQLVVNRGQTSSAPETVIVAPAPMMGAYREMLRKHAEDKQ